MRRYWKKCTAVGFLMFLGFWAWGTVRAFMSPYPPPPAIVLSSIDDYSTLSRQQVANNIREIGMLNTPLPMMLEQPDVDRVRVFEKTAYLSNGTAAFETDSARMRSALAQVQAVILNERNGGIAPQRRLTLEIGVHPDKFDALVDELRQIGSLESINVQQRDRTSEFRQLRAKRQSLKKHLEAVLKLRGGNNPSIDDTLKVEQKIQDIEKELDSLGVQLGDLLGKESFYQVNVTLAEFQPGGKLDRAYTIPQRLASGFLWAAAWEAAIIGAIAVAAGVYLSVRTLVAKS